MSGPVMTMVRVHLRTGWLAILVWVLALAATMEFTVAAIHGLYDTPAKVHTYAAAVKGDALMMLNGKIAGIDSLGGIVANEFGFMASFAIPFMAVSLVSRMTRKNEEQGRTEALLAGRIGRGTPLVAAILVATAAEAVTTGALFASFAGVGVPTRDAALYSLSMGALGLAFVGVTALAAQLAEHNRGVYAIGLGAIIAAYLLRGVGDVQWSPLTWLSPLGWQEQTRAFGDQRWWPLLIPLVVFGALVAASLAITARRDVGSALIAARAAEPSASRFLRTPLGIALRSHRGSLLGWTAATVIVSATFGSLAQPLVDAINGNPSLATAMGVAGTSGLDSVLAMTALIMALMGAGYAVQAIGVLHAEEASGRLETRLSGDRGRWAWLSVQLAVVAVGIVVVSATGVTALVISTSISVGHDVTGTVVPAIAAFLPAVAFFAGLTLLVFTAVPRWQPAVWLVYAFGAVVAYLGDSLNLAQPVLELSPFHLIGNPPATAVAAVDVMSLSVAAAACVAVAYGAFRRRGIPQA
jgi:ABC-2 type transport system permease protein